MFALFPFLSFFALIPLFAAATNTSFKRSITHTYLFGVFASASQYFWVSFVMAEGLWHLIILGTFLLTLYIGLFYLAAGLIFRLFRNKFPLLYLLFFPAAFICIDYCRTLGDISFPWMFLGYNMVGILPIAQLASVCGVYGLTFLIIATSIIIYEFIGSSSMVTKETIQRTIFPASKLFVCCAIVWCTISAVGTLRLTFAHQSKSSTKISCIQSNLDQNHWGSNSLDTSFTITESLAWSAGKVRPDLLVFPESALLCYLLRNNGYQQRVRSWSDSLHIPIIIGSLHWDQSTNNPYYNYLVYNTAFFLDTGKADYVPYYKMRLVGFSEALPFQGLFPVLSRVNLGEADFQSGKTPVTFTIGKSFRAVPFICYEIIYPGFVHSRINPSDNCIVNITNDGWFGRSSGPFQHAAMTRMRSIENGISLVRCANSGISECIDPYGRLIGATELYKRTILTCQVPTERVRTLYSMFGDWPVYVSAVVFLMGVLYICGTMKNRRSTQKA